MYLRDNFVLKMISFVAIGYCFSDSVRNHYAGDYLQTASITNNL